MQRIYKRCKINPSYMLCTDVFDNIDDLLLYLKEAEVNERIFDDYPVSSHKIGTDGWREYRTFDEAVECLKYGSNKFFKQLEENIRKTNRNIFNKLDMKKSKFKNDYVGFAPIVANAIIGNPINMINQNINKKEFPVLKIMIEKAIVSGVDSDESIKYYSAIFSLIETIEKKGIRCELVQCATSCEGKEIHIYTLKLKDYLQPLNVYKLNFPIISTDMFRRIGFFIKETCPNLKERRWKYTYGRVLAMNESVCSLDEGVPNEGMKELLNLKETDVYIPSAGEFDLEEKDTIEILKELINKTNLKRYISLN